MILLLLIYTSKKIMSAHGLELHAMFHWHYQCVGQSPIYRATSTIRQLKTYCPRRSLRKRSKVKTGKENRSNRTHWSR